MKEITTQDFKDVVTKSNKPVLVDFWAEWCGPCRIIAPMIEDLAKDYEGEVEIVKCNVDDNHQIAEEYQIKSIPTLLFFNKGEIVDKQVGATQKQNIVRKIELTLLKAKG